MAEISKDFTSFGFLLWCDAAGGLFGRRTPWTTWQGSWGLGCRAASRWNSGRPRWIEGWTGQGRSLAWNRCENPGKILGESWENHMETWDFFYGNMRESWRVKSCQPWIFMNPFMAGLFWGVTIEVSYCDYWILLGGYPLSQAWCQIEGELWWKSWQNDGKMMGNSMSWQAERLDWTTKHWGVTVRFHHVCLKFETSWKPPKLSY